MSYFFITGMYRSGTTLLQKLLSADERIISYEQPLPTAFFYLKNVFLQSLGYNDTIPLGTLFNETRYTQQDFLDFLQNYYISEHDIDQIFNFASSYDGVRTREILTLKSKIPQNIPFDQFYKIYIEELYKSTSGDKTAILKGSKEIVCEEYINYFLAQKIKTLLIIRDLRDVINSANFGKGKDYVGSVRPTLFSIRVWRKSIAMALHFQDNPYFLAIRYEDLIFNTQDTIQSIYKFLDLPMPELDLLFNQLSQNWVANSSFGQYRGLSNQSIGKYKENFTPEMTKYIEILAYPEMKIMNYQTDFINYQNYTSDEIRKIFSAFKEPIEVNHGLFEKDFSYKEENKQLELMRYTALESDDFNNKQQFFIFDDVYQKLKQAINE